MKKVFISTLLLVALSALATLKDDFHENSKLNWQTESSNSFEVKSTFEKNDVIQGETSSALKLNFVKTNKNSKNNWFSLSGKIPKNAFVNAQGILLKLTPAKRCQWWMQVTVKSNGIAYSCRIIPRNYEANHWQNRILKFKNFKANKKNAPKLDETKIDRIVIKGSIAGDVLYFNELSAWSEKKISNPVVFNVNNSLHNIFEPNTELKLSFTTNKKVKKNIALRCVVTDFFANEVLKKDLYFRGKVASFKWMPKLPGYYDVKAYWLDKAGKQISKESVILTSGSLEQGRGTLAIVPNSLEYNRQRMKELGEKAFFGFHGNFADLADLLGATWRLNNFKWKRLSLKDLQK